MKTGKLTWLLIYFLAAGTTLLEGVIFETPHFQQIKEHVTPESLVILDIDDTLLLPVQTLGNDSWFVYRLDQLKKGGLNHEEALDQALAEWEAIRHLTKVKVVEEGTVEIVRGIQNQGITVIGLTTQGLALATRTVQQLHCLGFDLSATAPSQEDKFFLNGHGVLYRKGILFTSGTAKGKALLQLLSLIGYKPERIVFINDKATHLRDVESAVEAEGIPFTGLRYSFSDARIAAFRSEITDIQWERSSFGHILSDEEAEAILETAQ